MNNESAIKRLGAWIGSYVGGRPRKRRPAAAETVNMRASDAARAQLGRSLAGGRVSIDRAEDAFFGNSLADFVTLGIPRLFQVRILGSSERVAPFIPERSARPFKL